MLAIWKREFKSYLHTVIGWLFMAVILFFVGLYFTATNLLYGSAYFSNVISACGFILLLAVPILTMRCLAEERKNKTDQLILTAPVSLGKIIAGKFLALASIFTIPILVICLYPLILMKFGNIPVAESYTAILGFYLYGLACMAVGVFISSLTESQVIAAVLSFAALFVCYIMSGLCNMISSEGNVLTKILGCFDFYTRFSVFLTGTLDLKAVIYFITVILLLLFLTCQSIQKRRWSISVKSLKTGVFSSGMIAVAIAVTVFINLVADQLPLSVSSIDMTSNHLYSLTDDTVQFLKNMKEDVTIYVYGKKSTQDETISRTLSKYESESSHIKVEYKDPVKYPNFASDYTSDTLQENSLIVVGEKRNKVISYADMYETQIDYNTYSQQTTGYDGEGRITSALDYVTAEEMPVVYRITGRYVILKRKPRQYTISGFVRDSASYESLIAATVVERSSGKGSVSNNYGFYSITLPPGKVVLSSSYVGYEPCSVTFELTRDTMIDLSLSPAGVLGEVVIKGISPRSDVLNSRVGVSDVPLLSLSF